MKCVVMNAFPQKCRIKQHLKENSWKLCTIFLKTNENIFWQPNNFISFLRLWLWIVSLICAVCLCVREPASAFICACAEGTL